MKKVILFLSIMGAALLMTSCLKEGSNNYTDQGFVYLDEDDRGTPFGKAINPQYGSVRLITHSSMMAMERGSIKYFGFRWDEESGFTPLSLSGQAVQADNVQLISEPMDIPSTYLQMTARPDTDDPATFDEIANPIYSSDKNFMNDLWILQYAYTAKKGEKASVSFYQREGLNEVGEIVIDMYLTLTGTPENDTPEKNGDAIAVDMSPLRSMYSGGSDAKQELKIKFNYYKKGSNQKPEEVSLPLQQAFIWEIGSESAS